MNKVELVFNDRTFYFDENNCLGHGGNGVVYLLLNEKVKEEYVVKFFNSKNKINGYRYKRFKLEVSFLKEMNIRGIVPCLGEQILPKITKVNTFKKTSLCSYYIMPKCIPLDVTKCEFIPSLKDCLYLAKTLKQLHELGYAHRDIKPENILYYEGNPCLSDFGLLWEPNRERLTGDTEKVGPGRIIPPELEAGNEHDERLNPTIGGQMYPKSDIYLLAKVLWMMLKKDNYGFRGEYSRSDNKIYLDYYERNVVECFEPIHQLMEKATKKDWRKRLSIDEFIMYLDEQIKILSGDFNENDINYLNRITKSKKFYISVSPNYKRYTDITSIHNYLNDIRNVALIQISNGKIENRYRIKEIDFNRNGCIRMVVKMASIEKEILFNPISLDIDSNYNATINIGKIDSIDSGFSLFSFSPNVNNEKYYLDPTFKIYISIN